MEDENDGSFGSQSPARHRHERKKAKQEEKARIALQNLASVPTDGP